MAGLKVLTLECRMMCQVFYHCTTTASDHSTTLEDF
jgi:hypothetical protein